MALISLFKNSNQQNPQTLICGPDEFLNDYLANDLLQDERYRDLDHEIVDCELDGLDNLIRTLSESSIFSTEKIIIVKKPFFLTSKVAKKYDRQLQQLLKIFSQAEALTDTVILVASYEKIDRRKKLVKTIIQHFNLVEPIIKPYEVGAVGKAIIKAEGYNISNSALTLLVERSDQVLDTVISNFNKLKVAAPDHQLTEELVAANVDLSLDQNIFAILESAMQHRYQEAMTRLEDQLRYGSNPIQLLAVFENQIELLALTKLLQKRGRSEAQIVKELGVHPYRVKLAMKNRSSLETLEKVLAAAIELEYKYKNGTYRSEEFLKMFLLSV